MINPRASLALTAVAASAAAVLAPGVATGSSAATSVPHCQYHQLRVTESKGDAGLGHSGNAIRFHNRSDATCSLRGYPGAAGLNRRGKQVEQARRTKNGYLGGVKPGHPIPTIVLRPGQVAAASIEGSDVPPGHQKHCRVLHGLLVTPPNDQQSVELKYAPADCRGLEIHPVVRGRTGS